MLSTSKIINNRIIKIIIVIIGIGLIISLSRNIYRLLQAGNQVKLTEQNLEELEKEHQELQEQRDYYQSEEFIEEEARNKLNMSKPGETVVILPPNISGSSGETASSEISEIPNWRKWFNLFF